MRIHNETKTQTHCYVESCNGKCTDNPQHRDREQLERAAAWAAWDYVGKN